MGKTAPAPKIRALLAANPSMMTQHGTNTYILGTGQVAVIDPGPALAAHQAAILSALGPGENISHIFVTHAHLDHSGLASSLSRLTGAPIYGFGPADAGRSAAMQRLAGTLAMGGEGVDTTFRPDIKLADGDIVNADGWQLEAIHTPGHMGNHLCFACDTTLFSGDHVMGWSTSLISPPDGDMTDYMAALRKLTARRWQLFLPGHGAPVEDPAQRLADLIAHRHNRETALLAALGTDIHDIPGLTRQIYPDLAAVLIPAAARNILAHLIDLEGRKLVRAAPHPNLDAIFTRR